MIQRIQSIFLLIVILCGVGWILFIEFNETSTSDPDTWIFWAGFTSGASILLAIITIFLFKNRKLQRNLCIGLVILNVLLFVSTFLLINYWVVDKIWTICFSLIAIIAAFLARRYIKKDEELVRSADRIR